MAEPDSGGFSEQPTATVEGDSAASEPAIEFGAGIRSDPVDAEDSTEATTEQPDAASTAGGETPAADADTSAAEDAEAAGLRLADYTQKTQKHAGDVRAWEAQKAQQEADIAARTAALEEVRGAVQQTATGEGPRSQQIRQLLAQTPVQSESNPNGITQAQREEYAEFANLHQSNEDLAQTVKGLETRLEQMAPQIEQAGQQAGALTEATQQQHLAIARGQMEEAVKLFGQGTWDATKELVGPMFLRGGRFVSPPHPVTGADMSMAEVVAALSGKDIAVAQAAQNGNRGARDIARRTATPRGTTPAADMPTGTKTRDQVIAEINADPP